MNRRVGIFCILLGICCLLAAVGFIVYNRVEEKSAANAAESMLQNVQEQLEHSSEENVVNPAEPEENEELPQEMITTKVDGYDCIGILSIPVLELELPVLTDWSYEKLKVAPCIYYGTYSEKDFVIAAHNYQSHFGRLSELQPDDLILFTDVSGEVHCYEVVLLETLPGNATEEMITSGFDLSLYTCTTGGGSRVTVRCRSMEK